MNNILAAWDNVLYTLGNPVPEHSVENKVPVTILSGFLGAGKTTLLCQILSQTQSTIVAVVNDIASVNIDAELVRREDSETIELENGCACCVLGSDLQQTLDTLGKRDNPPDAVVIEASGLADPMGIAQTVSNSSSTKLDCIITLVNTVSFQERVDDPVTETIFRRQLEAAHLVVLTGSNDKQLHKNIEQAVISLVPGRPVLSLDIKDAAYPAAVLGLFLNTEPGARVSPHYENHSIDLFDVHTLKQSTIWPADTFFNLLDQMPSHIYRLKGNLSIQEPDGLRHYEVQAVGSRWQVKEGCESNPCERFLVVIGAKQQSVGTFIEQLKELDQSS